MHERLLQIRRELDARAVASRALDCVRRDDVEPDVLGLVRGFLGAGQLDQLRDQRRHLAELLDDVGEQPFPLARRQRALAGEHLDVGPEARERRAQLVRGVGDELSLLARRLLERGQHRVEACTEPAQLVSAGRLDPF